MKYFMAFILVATIVGIGISGLEVEVQMGGDGQQKTRARIAELSDALMIYQAENDTYPETLQVLVDRGILRKIKADAWGQAFDYNPKTGEVSSLGPISHTDR